MSFNARTPELFFLSGLNENKPFVLIMTAVAVIQLMLIYFGGEVFRCTPLLVSDLIKTAILAATVLPVGSVIKLLQPHRKKDL